MQLRNQTVIEFFEFVEVDQCVRQDLDVVRAKHAHEETLDVQLVVLGPLELVLVLVDLIVLFNFKFVEENLV